MGDKDSIFMEQAYELAKKAIGRTSPNPLVGCVIVKDDQVIGSGYHKKAGSLHAEIETINSVKEKFPNFADKIHVILSNATMYVTLEPCCHSDKKTPPCADAIIEAGIKKIVVGTIDPNPAVNHHGIEALRKKGIDVKLLENSELAEKIVKLNEGYNKFIKHKLPFVAIKAAVTIDGKIATYSGESKWISNDASRKFANELRNIYDAVLVSSNTVIADNPLLTCRIEDGSGRNPVRIILDSEFKIPEDANVFNDTNFLLAITEKAQKNPEKITEAIKKGWNLITVKQDNQGNIDLNDLFARLAEQNITSILVEGGNKLAASLFKNKLVDKCIYVIAPTIIGNDGKPAVAELGIDHLKDAIHLKNTMVKVLDNNVVIEGYVEHKN
ncbi:bifunctional diaminohydroxyphosphoribosylaminopyrimidine deaminase/5-amino-6-(5-phosphoribosylamino)uracil reductase RibD [Candidatus Woesearchaeota archaeon]|nr:bifunctional diaminohydroxyphosphoribosylaminopyrimidine deaminase/5-amino-6-(5-phosphoribosylamino)uracil reductase RibD [Candidatus Woesearchaeota archaeon]